jgi:pimeloyl-ACP methyl ester carboxylesterase
LKSITLAFVALQAFGLVSCSLHRTPTPVARERGFVESTNDASIYYERAGAGPAIVLIHGLGGNHAVWYRQVPRLSAEHTIVTVSQRGFAPSTGDHGPLDVDEMVGDLIAVLDHLEIERAAIVGQSMGGWTALAATLSHPDRVRAVVLADTFAGIFDDHSRAHYEEVAERARALASSPPSLGYHPALNEDFSDAHREEGYLYQLLSTFGAPDPGAIVHTLGRYSMDEKSMAANKVPALFVVGRHDAIFPPELVQKVSRRLAGAQLRIIADAGHSPYYETPEKWADIVLSFLDSVD